MAVEGKSRIGRYYRGLAGTASRRGQGVQRPSLLPYNTLQDTAELGECNTNIG